MKTVAWYSDITFAQQAHAALAEVGIPSSVGYVPGDVLGAEGTGVGRYFVEVEDANFESADALLCEQWRVPVDDTPSDPSCCPKCNSSDVSFNSFSYRSLLMQFLIVAMPWLWKYRRWHCGKCAHTWDDGESAQPGAAPNGGPATPVRNSGATGGPPSVS